MHPMNETDSPCDCGSKSADDDSGIDAGLIGGLIGGALVGMLLSFGVGYIMGKKSAGKSLSAQDSVEMKTVRSPPAPRAPEVEVIGQTPGSGRASEPDGMTSNPMRYY